MTDGQTGKTTLLAMCDIRTDMKKKMRTGVFSKNIREGASERASDEMKI